MQSFLQFNPTRLWFGKGQIEQLQQELGTTGKKSIARIWRRKHQE